MTGFIETIKVKDKKIYNLAYHNARLNRTRQEVLGQQDSLSLEEFITIPGDLDNRLYKLRIVYSEKIEKVEFIPYSLPVITSLVLVYDDTIFYGYKSTDRSALTKVKKDINAGSEILIVKNGLLTDTSFSNIVCAGENCLITPKQPLLKGTKRARLLDDNIISEADLRPEDLKSFNRIYLINAMIDLEDNVSVDIKHIQ